MNYTARVAVTANSTSSLIADAHERLQLVFPRIEWKNREVTVGTITEDEVVRAEDGRVVAATYTAMVTYTAEPNGWGYA